MLLWRVLADAAKNEKIDTDSDRARAWVHRHLPHLLLVPLDQERKSFLEGEREQVQERFRWELEWPDWQDNFRALLWLVQRRISPPKPRTFQDRIPPFVQRVCDNIVARLRLDILTDWASEARFQLRFSGGFETNGRVDSLKEFWEVVFATFFWPDALPLTSFCSGCGKHLKQTKKLKKPSQGKLCPSCRVKKWQREHPDEARERWREAKRRERGR
jgi:hypothetical protein